MQALACGYEYMPGRPSEGVKQIKAVLQYGGGTPLAHGIELELPFSWQLLITIFILLNHPILLSARQISSTSLSRQKGREKGREICMLGNRHLMQFILCRCSRGASEKRRMLLSGLPQYAGDERRATHRWETFRRRMTGTYSTALYRGTLCVCCVPVLVPYSTHTTVLVLRY
jgi:hypothetical protein